MTISWQDSYSVGVEIIDSQHKIFFQILNEVYEAIDKGIDDMVVFNDVIKKLEAYTNYHFSTEEQFFDKFHFEQAEPHKKMHQAFSQRLAEIKDLSSNQKTLYSTELVDFLEDWLIKHVNGQDKLYTDCFHKHGLY